MKMKKLFTMALAVIMALTMTTSVFAQGKIFVDLQEVVSDTAPEIINERTMVPVRAIAEMIGYDVYWRAETQQVHVCEKGSEVPVIAMEIGNTKAYYTVYAEELGETMGAEVILDVPATVVNNRTLVPLRFVSEAVGYVVEYMEESGDVHLFSPDYIERHQGDGKGGEPGGTADDGKGGLGIAEDGKGEDPEGVNADGKGDVVPLTMEEMEYVLSITTNSWLEMTKEEKDKYVVMVGRWWEDYENIIVEDYDEMVEVVDHQMEQYFKNDVDEYVFFTICEIYEVDKSTYVE